MKIVCLCVGEKYGPEYVERLHRGLLRHSPRAFEFDCITEGRFPGWWNKLLLFGPDERTVFLDLDVVITGNIDFLFEYDGPFCAWKDPWNQGLNSSVMSIGPGYGEEIKKAFLDHSRAAMREFYSDQHFINHMVHGPDYWPAEKVKSYKADRLHSGPGEASIVVFHGDPKPAAFTEGWVRDAWV